MIFSEEMGPPPRQECPFSSKCYRRNPHHFREFAHPHLAALLKTHPSLQLPSNVATPSITVEALQEQLKVYKDIEQGLMKSQEKTLEKRTDRNSLELPNQRENSNKIFSMLNTEKLELWPFISYID